MKVKTISYQKTFNLGNYCSERIGLDLELEEGKTIEQTLDEAKKTATDWHIANNPQMYGKPKSNNLIDAAIEFTKTMAEPTNGMVDSYGTKTKEAPIEKRSNSIIDQLNTSPDIKSLECYKLIVKGKPDLQKAYDQKMKELSK